MAGARMTVPLLLLVCLCVVGTQARESDCLVFKDEGEACDTGVGIHCTPYLRCVKNVCVNPSEGIACVDDGPSACGGRGFRCVGGTCRFMRQWGDTCTLDAHCESGTCGADGTCTAVPPGGACESIVANPCGAGQFCSQVTNTCVDRLAKDADCTAEMNAAWQPNVRDLTLVTDICGEGQCEATGGGAFACRTGLLTGEEGEVCGPLRTSRCNLNKNGMVCDVPLLPPADSTPYTSTCKTATNGPGDACSVHRDCTSSTLCVCDSSALTGGGNGTCEETVTSGCTSEQTSYLLCIVTRAGRCHPTSVLDTYQGWRWGPDGSCSGICATEALQWNCCQTRALGVPFFNTCGGTDDDGDGEDSSSARRTHTHTHALLGGVLAALVTAALLRRAV